jgi:hypothetical protein
MNSFLRFILVVLAAGIAVNLSVVFLANAQSQHRQLLEDEDNRRDLAKLLNDFDQSLRRADVAVESQRITHDNTILQSTLLVRQYHATGSEESGVTLVHRITIDGDRLAIYGTLLQFNEFFAEDAPEFQILRKKRLAYFSYLCGEDEKPIPNQPDERFTLMPQWETPDLTRLDILKRHPSIYEVRLWRYVWNQIPDEQHPLPWSSNWKNGVNATFMKPSVIAVHLGHTYTAWINCNNESDSLSWKEDDSTALPHLTDLIVDQMKEQEAQTRPAPDSAPASRLP